jgi:probable rRNA maturation factor
MNIELTNKSQYQVDEHSLIAVAAFTLSQLGLHPDCQLSITLVSEEEMSQLNLKWMDEAGPTDVLSFPMDELRPDSQEPGIIGDIVICPSYAAKQVEKLGNSLAQELELLTVHGSLHLLGFDHRDPEEVAQMFGLQDRYLEQWRASN